MAHSGPILLIEDDTEDEEIFREILNELGNNNELIWFSSCTQCMEYLKANTEQPFIIFCDVNLPMQNGIEFKRLIDNDPVMRKKSIPFIFYSTSIEQKLVNEAYMQMTVQGFFQKKNNYGEIRESIRRIIEYWLYCVHPNAL